MRPHTRHTSSFVRACAPAGRHCRMCEGSPTLPQMQTTSCPYVNLALSKGAGRQEYQSSPAFGFVAFPGVDTRVGPNAATGAVAFGSSYSSSSSVDAVGGSDDGSPMPPTPAFRGLYHGSRPPAGYASNASPFLITLTLWGGGGYQHGSAVGSKLTTTKVVVGCKLCAVAGAHEVPRTGRSTKIWRPPAPPQEPSFKTSNHLKEPGFQTLHHYARRAANLAKGGLAPPLGSPHSDTPWGLCRMGTTTHHQHNLVLVSPTP